MPGSRVWNRPARTDDGPAPWRWLVLLTALAVVLRIPGLNDGLWLDEIITLVESVRHPLSRIVTVFPGDNQHTLYSVLAHLSIDAFGEHPWSLRLPAMLIGVATVPMLFVFAREFVGRTEAVLASLLLSAAYHHVWFSQNARAYSTLTFLTVLSSWLVLRGLRRGRPGDWVWYGVVAALGVYAHLTMVFLVVSHAALCAGHLVFGGDAGASRRWRVAALGFGVAGLLSALLYAPVLLAVRESVAEGPTPVAGATAGWAATEMLRGLQVGLGSAIGVLLGAVLFLAGLASYFKQSPWLLALFLAPGILTGAAAVVLQRPVRPRFFFFLIAFALLIVVRGALEIGRVLGRDRGHGGRRFQSLGTIIVTALSVLSIVAVGMEARYPKQDFDGAMRFVDAGNSGGDPVVVAGGARYPYQVYYQRDWEAVRSHEDLVAVRSRGRPVWVLFTLRSYIAGELLTEFDADCTGTRVFPGTLRGGDVTVCVLPPLNVRPSQAFNALRTY